MIINNGSVLADVLQALSGTWSVSTDDDWTCYEVGKFKLWKKMCQSGKNVLPKTFIKNRKTITPYLKFQLSEVTGGCITLQQQYIDLGDSAVVIILDL